MRAHLLLYRIGNRRKTYAEIMRFEDGMDISEMKLRVKGRVQGLANRHFTEVQTRGLYDVTALGRLPENLQEKYGAVTYDDLDAEQLLPLFMSLGVSLGMEADRPTARPLV